MQLIRPVAAILLVCSVSALLPAPAAAHFILVAPDAWMSQDALGLPEKLGPCGDEGGGIPTGKVTAFEAGQTISITVNEVIPHPGHYRVALALSDRGELPPEPAVTPVIGDPCGAAAIEDPAVFPILADNVLPHTQAFDAPQTFTVTLPADVSCTHCTLQVIEFMSSHGVPCFYHHCADISIQPAAPTSPPTPAATVTPTPTPLPTPSSTPVAAATTPPCIGDCDHNGAVTINELLRCVGIALGDLPPASCPALDPANAGATISAVVTAVDNALNGCPMQP